jgi:hypothetical protein
MNKRSRTQSTIRPLTSFYSPAPTPVIPPRHVEVQPEGPEPIETGVSNVNADNVETKK